MSRFFIATCAAVLFAAASGCQQDKSDGGMNGGGTMSTSADACSMCPDVQTAKADGTCPKCGMRVSSMSTGGGNDACSMCAGVQPAKADGTCPSCGMKVTKS